MNGFVYTSDFVSSNVTIKNTTLIFLKKKPQIVALIGSSPRGFKPRRDVLILSFLSYQGPLK